MKIFYNRDMYTLLMLLNKWEYGSWKLIVFKVIKINLWFFYYYSTLLTFKEITIPKKLILLLI